MDNKSLMNIVNESVAIENMLIESGGELTPEIEQALRVTEENLTAKADGYHLIIERFDTLEAYYKSRAEFFKQVSTQCSNVVSRLKNNIKYAMAELNVDEIKGLDVRFKLTPTSGSLVIEDEELIPIEFKTEVVSTVLNKPAVKAALSVGGVVPGAKLEKGSSLRVFANLPNKKTKTIEGKNE